MNYTSRHLIAAHAVVLKLQAAGVGVEQHQAKDIIAEALADAERGVFVASRETPAGACDCSSINGLPHAHDCPARVGR